MALVTLDEVKAQLQVDTDAGDLLLQLLIEGVSGAVLAWLKDEWRAYVAQPGVTDSNGDPIPAIDSNGELIPKPVVKVAALVEIASQFRFRDGVGAAVAPANWGHGYVLSTGATSLLFALRRSTVQ